MASALIETGVRFPNNSAQVSALPNNTIAFWSGSIASIPAGWQLCDGTNGTPDLRNKFLVGAGNSYSIGNTGGDVTVYLDSPQLPAHSHPSPASVVAVGNHNHPHPGSTGSVGTHVHPLAMAQMAGTPLVPGGGTLGPLGSTNPGGGSHVHNGASNPTGAHTHTVSVTVDSVGDGTGHENRPPYYALAMIMEVA
jgi:microcystin-dependent protein